MSVLYSDHIYLLGFLYGLTEGGQQSSPISVVYSRRHSSDERKGKEKVVDVPFSSPPMPKFSSSRLVLFFCFLGSVAGTHFLSQIDSTIVKTKVEKDNAYYPAPQWFGALL